MDKNRKTNIPVQSGPDIVEWLLKNCTKDELVFMASLHSNRKNFSTFLNILTRLTDYNAYHVFYDNLKMNADEFMIYRASKRGEVAGLKAFALACQLAIKELNKRGGDID